jgi:hypothetical protein
MIGIPLGLLYANANEWVIHKYLLHGRGRDKKSFWSFHWHDHHKTVRQLDHEDPMYRNKLFASWDPQTKEVAALLAGAVVHAPLLPVAPFFVGAVWFSAFNYYRVHKKSHLDIEWAKEHLPWHWDHHMGPNQDANWCVTHPFFDWVMGTRKKYLNTPEEIAARPQREAFTAKKRAEWERKHATPTTADEDQAWAKAA